MISGTPALASSRNAGFSRYRPAPIRMPIATTAIPTLVRLAASPISSPVGASNVTISSSGTMARSWNNRMANAFLPWPVPRSSFSFSACITSAVDDSARPSPITTDTCQESPSSSGGTASAAPQTSTCVRPTPKISPRISNSFFGFISSPITNRNSTTPNSAKCSSLSGFSVKPRVSVAPTITPAAIYPRIDPSPMRLSTGTATHAIAISASASRNWISSFEKPRESINNQYLSGCGSPSGASTSNTFRTTDTV